MSTKHKLPPECQQGTAEGRTHLMVLCVEAHPAHFSLMGAGYVMTCCASNMGPPFHRGGGAPRGRFGGECPVDTMIS